MMTFMLTALKGGALYVAGAVVLAVIGASTYLASQSILTGSDWLVVGTSILASVGIVTTAHVTGNQVAAALNTPPPIPAAPTTSPPAAPTAPQEVAI